MRSIHRQLPLRGSEDDSHKKVPLAGRISMPACACNHALHELV